MGRQSLSPEALDDFRSRAVEVATALIAQEGYAALTIRRLASALGCSPMTPYRYFEDRDDIFAAVRGAAFDQFADAQEAALKPGQDPVERLQALGEAYVRFAIDHPNAYRLKFALSQGDTAGHPVQGPAEMRAWQPMSSSVAAAVEAGVLEGDPLEVAHLYWSSMHGLVSLHLAGKLVLGRRLGELVEPMLAALIRGTSKRPTPTPLYALPGASSPERDG